MNMTSIRIILALGIVFMLLAIPLVAYADLNEPDTIELEATRVWRHMLEADDLLLIARYNVHYGNYTAQPYQPITETFYFTYAESAESTVVGNETAYPFFNLGYAKGLVAFYWEADDEDKPAWDDLGNVTITGTDLFDTPPSGTYTLTAADWTSGTQPSTQREDLRQWLLNNLMFLDLDWNNWYADHGFTEKIVGLVGTAGGTYNVASAQGEAYLTLTIENIKRMVPLLFMVQTDYPFHEETDWTLEQQLNYEALHEGDVVGNATEALSSLIGGVGRIWTSTLVIIIGAIACVIACQTAWQKASCGMLMAYVIILMATPEGLFQMGLMALFAVLAVLSLVQHYFWSRSVG